MILFYGIPSEPPLRLAIDAAEAAHLPFVVLNQRRSHLADFALDADGDSEGLLVVDGRACPLAGFSGVYVRATDPSLVPELRARGRRPPDPTAVERAQALNDLLTEWLETTRVRVANRPIPTASNISKPYQAQAAMRAGFLTPTTLISNDPDEVRAFHARHGRVIFKSSSSVRSIVRELTAEHARDLARIRDLPTQFQALVEGVNVRVHVVDTEVFATEIETPAIDYRYASRDDLPMSMRPTELPPDVAQRCVDLSRDLGLSFTGIDLMRGRDGRWTCFEVNPAPAYSFFEEQTGQPVAAALVRYLS